MAKESQSPEVIQLRRPGAQKLCIFTLDPNSTSSAMIIHEAASTPNRIVAVHSDRKACTGALVIVSYFVKSCKLTYQE